MTVNYIVKGFDKDFYKFDAVVVPVNEKRDKSEQEVSVFRPYCLDDFLCDLREIVKELSFSEFKPDRVQAVKSEKTGIYYIFVLISYLDRPARRRREEPDENYIFCCEKMIKYIKKLDVEKILIHPVFNQLNFNFYARPDTDNEFLENALKNNIDRFSKKNIYIGVQDSYENREVKHAIYRMKKGLITYEECMRIFVESQIEKSHSHTHKLIRIAEIETHYRPKSLVAKFREDMNNYSDFFYEYLNRYQGTATELAGKADIDKSTVSKIKSREYEGKLRSVVISLAIALDLTVEDRKRFINSARFSYPVTEHDCFIEQQLRKKRYDSVIDFNEDIIKEYPKSIIKTRTFRNSNGKKSDK